MNLLKKSNVIFLSLLSMCLETAYATASSQAINEHTLKPQTSAHALTTPVKVLPEESSAVEERATKEQLAPPNFFTIGFYKPNYVMPYYYTGSPYNRIYENQTPNNEKLTRDEIKYQLSFKVPVWKNILGYRSTLYFAYTQLSYWQAYNKEAFFRSTDYEPEAFLANEINLTIYKDFTLNFFNIGAEHQSNGFGNTLERSWNRAYIEAIASKGNFMMSVKPWYIFHDHSLEVHNPNIGSYLGYVQLLFAYKFDKSVLNLRTYGLGVHGGRHTSAELAFSFPLTSYLNAYVQVFSGYGQSLIEYNHRTNSAGVGISLSNWI